MRSVALIGPDGAGKTTVSRMLLESSGIPFRYLYMGISIDSSNVALPTSRLVQFLKRMRGKARRDREGSPALNKGKSRTTRTLRAAARLVNRLAEEWYRQLLSWSYEIRGLVPLYDRHFLFDFAPGINGDAPDRLGRRIHRWHLAHIYPRPDLVIYLDAPADVLYARKRESSPEELERRRQAMLRQGKQMPNFICVDATQPLEKVYADVVRHITEFCERHHGPANIGDQRNT